MHIHILGICGTFMGSLAQLAKALGHTVTGSDANVYPPMSTQLESAGIVLTEGYDPGQLEPAPDLVVIGNAMSRGNPAVEAVLNRGIAYTSGPQWLCDHLLQEKWVLAVAGTHGKTTTASMLAWILEYANMAPGYLIGGVPLNFDVSARLGSTPFFVVEADEYDSAFFDKRSKFIHYRPRTTILNNLEFDHADIFEDLAAIQKQFHHLVRTIPAEGQIILPKADAALQEVIEKGCWTPLISTSLVGGEGDWQARLLEPDGSAFEVQVEGLPLAIVTWDLTGTHNVLNALAAMAAARHVGVAPELACAALGEFKGVKRRMECVGEVASIKVYDDFAHHPTAIATTLEGIRAKVGHEKVVAIIEPRSNTMRMGVHRQRLSSCVDAADVALWYQPEGVNWSLADVVHGSHVPAKLAGDIDTLIEDCLHVVEPNTHVVIMSNGGFGGVHQKLLAKLKTIYSES